MAMSMAMGGLDRWIGVLLSLSLVSLLLFLSALSSSSSSPPYPPPASYIRRGGAAPPSLAYLLVGARGDSPRLLRLLLAVYHPRNHYLLHLSADASDAERAHLATAIATSAPALRAFRNVAVVGRPTAGTPIGSSGLAGTLRAAAVLLRLDPAWDWFVTLSAADYPLVTQDDLIHVLSSVPRELNFIDHTSNIGLKESERVQPIIVDAGIYLRGRKNFFRATEKRANPNAFKFFTGSPWVILNRQFIEYCVLGWENLPRILLMYFNNVMLPQEGYFQSVICNSPEFRNFTVNNDLRYMVRDDPPQIESLFLNMYDKMVNSGLPFARQFQENEPLLDKIDENILKRWGHRLVPGVWCSGRKRWLNDPCSQWSNVNMVRPGPQADKFQQYVNRIVQDAKLNNNSCRQ